jgi:multidrug resistance efflux pump
MADPAIGTALQRLDPRSFKDDLLRAEGIVDRLARESERLRVEAHLIERVAAQEQDLAEREKLMQRFETTMDKSDDLGARADAKTAHLAAQRAAQRTAPYALFALAIAVASEALALYGVASPCTGWPVTFAVSLGVVTGAALLLVPLTIGWIRLVR